MGGLFVEAGEDIQQADGIQGAFPDDPPVPHVKGIRVDHTVVHLDGGVFAPMLPEIGRPTGATSVSSLAPRMAVPPSGSKPTSNLQLLTARSAAAWWSMWKPMWISGRNRGLCAPPQWRTRRNRLYSSRAIFAFWSPCAARVAKSRR